MRCYNCSTTSLRAFLATTAHIDSHALQQLLCIRGNQTQPSFRTPPLHLRQCKRALSGLQASTHHYSSNQDDLYIPFDTTSSSQDDIPQLPRPDHSLAQKLQEPISTRYQDKSTTQSHIVRASSSGSQKPGNDLNLDQIKAFFNAKSISSVDSKIGNEDAGPAAPKTRKSSQSLHVSKTANEKTTGGHEREGWQIQKQALAEKFGSAHWAPRKRLSPDALDGIRKLHAQYPEKYTTPELARQFEVSPEAIRRILKSKWRPSDEEEADRRRRWDNRGQAIWSKKAELGVKPPKKWREMGIGIENVPAHSKSVRYASRRNGDRIQSASRRNGDRIQSASRRNGDVNQKPDYVLVEALSQKGGASVPTVPLSQRIL